MYQGYLIDLDGTLYRGQEEIPEAAPFIDSLLAKDIPFRLVTNNATRTIEGIVNHLKDNFNIGVTPQHVYTSTLALIDYIKANYPGQSAFVIGDPALKEQVELAGFAVDEGLASQLVIQGLQQDVKYRNLTMAVQLILKGAPFLVTNTDRLIPTDEGLKPSSGAITSFISYATQQEPLVFGKPNSPIMNGALESIGLTKNQVAMIGDNYETDIMAGINAKMDTILVLSGVTQIEDLENVATQPTHIIKNLAEWKL